LPHSRIWSAATGVADSRIFGTGTTEDEFDDEFEFEASKQTSIVARKGASLEKTTP
jgi:hypothetical protein